MENKFEQIKKQLKLSEYIGRFIKLKPLSRLKYLGLCPFHREKTPSFHINDEVALFHCFGCSKGGDIFSFYCLMHACDKKKALIDLAAICNISVSFSHKQNTLSVLKELFQLNDAVKSFLHDRGVMNEFISKFQIGWSPSFPVIESFLRVKRLDFSHLGFSKKFFQVFQNRVVFPIWNEYGAIVSFGGRTFDSNLAKYINGADSDIFHKKTVLYGLNFVKNQDPIYLVEGYLDVILMHQRGYAAVAAMGTAISKEQLQLLWVHTDKIIICMDGDHAGKNAAYRVAVMSLSLIQIGKEIAFIVLNDHEDPASYLCRHKNFSDLKEIPLYEFLFISQPLSDDPDKRAKFYDQLFSLSAAMPDYNLRVEYRKKWNEMRWKKNSIKHDIRLHSYSKDDLILLLFKYIMCYNQLLDHVAEKFLNLKMNSECTKNLVLMLSGKDVNPMFFKQVMEVGVVPDFLTDIQVVQEWDKIFEYVQFLDDSNIQDQLITNFSESKWELYKQWLTQKEKFNEEK